MMKYYKLKGDVLPKNHPTSIYKSDGKDIWIFSHYFQKWVLEEFTRLDELQEIVSYTDCIENDDNKIAIKEMTKIQFYKDILE